MHRYACLQGTGKSESVMITNEKGRLTQEEIDHMVTEPQFSAEDETQKKHIGVLDTLSSYVYSLKSELDDSEGLCGKLDADNKKTYLDAIKETAGLIDSEGQLATADDLEKLRIQTSPTPLRPSCIAADPCLLLKVITMTTSSFVMSSNSTSPILPLKINYRVDGELP